MKTATRPSLAPTLIAAASMLLVGGAAMLWSSTASAKCDDDALHTKQQRAMKSHDHRSSHAALGQKPNGSGVRFTSVAPKSMKVGQATKVTLSFAAASADDAMASVRMPDGLSAKRADGAPLTDMALKRDQPTTVDVWVTAKDDGTQYFDVSTTRDGRTSVQSVALKVGSGVVKLKPNGTLVTTPSGEKIVSMPAQ